jgi:hypothetical protein
MDLVDVRSVSVRIGGRVFELGRSADELWEVTIPVASGLFGRPIEMELVATDYARNSRAVQHTVVLP